ncbi:hypothetical protein HID58_010829, partial [Brassica napus]
VRRLGLGLCVHKGLVVQTDGQSLSLRGYSESNGEEGVDDLQWPMRLVLMGNEAFSKGCLPCGPHWNLDSTWKLIPRMLSLPRSKRLGLVSMFSSTDIPT